VRSDHLSDHSLLGLELKRAEGRMPTVGGERGAGEEAGAGVPSHAEVGSPVGGESTVDQASPER